MNRGTLAVGVIFSVAAMLAGFAVWWQYQQQRRAVTFWGRDRALLIRHAPNVELLRLEADTSADSSSETVQYGTATYRVAERKDMTDVVGLLHARHSLIEDHSFAWGEAESEDSQDKNPPTWRFAFRFAESQQETMVFFDKDCRHVGSADQKVATLIPKISTGLLKYTADQFRKE